MRGKVKKAFKGKIKGVPKKSLRKPRKKGTKINKVSKINRKTKTIKKTKRRSEKTRKKTPSLILIRHIGNPVISPNPDNDWEAWQTFNPGAILLNNKVHFLYRAIGKDGVSRFGYAVSDDGFVIDEKFLYPVYQHKIEDVGAIFNFYSFASGGSFGGAEDPRLVRVDEEKNIYVTYTTCDNGLRVALTSIKVEDFLQKRWRWKPPKLISPPGEVHKNWVLFPEKIKGKYALLTSINPEISITYLDNLDFNDNLYIKSFYGNTYRKNCWDNWVRGAGPPPIKTKYGWLLLYHAMEKNDYGKYKVGAMLLDLENPAKILHRLPYPILEPEEVYENNGFKSGVVYASGAVVKDNNLLVYYGAADSFVGVAYADFEEFLQNILREIKPKLKRQFIKQRR